MMIRQLDNPVDLYLELADRPNTRQTYAAAVRHYELDWHGVLPATPEAIARYLADYASTLSINTLRTRLAGLANWHRDQGFVDPTKAAIVTQVLKGIRAAHAVAEKQAKPLPVLQLQRVSDWLEHSCSAAAETPGLHRLRQARDQAMLLIGFWRGFRADELSRLLIENVAVEPGVGMTIFLPRTKGDRDALGRSYRCPALSRLCPVAAYERWLAISGLTEGPVFRKIDRWGHLQSNAITAGSIVPWLRRLFAAAGVEAPETYSSHSLRRGFAGWARSCGWDIKELMEYVGWQDVAAAMRYLEISDDALKAKFEAGLPAATVVSEASVNAPSTPPPHRPRRSRQTSRLTLVK